MLGNHPAIDTLTAVKVIVRILGVQPCSPGEVMLQNSPIANTEKIVSNRLNIRCPIKTAATIRAAYATPEIARSAKLFIG